MKKRTNIFITIILTAAITISASFLWFNTIKIQSKQLTALLQDSLSYLSHRLYTYDSINRQLRSMGQHLLTTEEPANPTTPAKILKTAPLTPQFNITIDGEEQVVQTQEQLLSVKSELENTIAKMEALKQTGKPLDIVSSKGKKVQYVGQVDNNQANGFGVGFFETGSVYKGEWKRNMRHGKGLFTWKDEEYYEGNFVDDKRSGYGEYHWKNGEIYKGMWENDMRHGEGKLYKKNGKLKKQGAWKNDEIQ